MEAEDANLAEQEQQKLRAQRGPVAFLKRFLILHSSKLVGLLVFATAMQCQSAIGWLLVGESCRLPQCHGVKGDLRSA